jgi:nicotinate-nucleotide adenylyltransferase
VTGTSVPEDPTIGAHPSGPASIGILGGTFNPPHLGHLALAASAREGLGLEEVWLVPARTSPFKLGEEDPGPEHRLAMCRLAVASAPGLSVCALELERSGPSYTVDTLQAIHASHPHSELTFIVGADTAATMPSWEEPVELLELAGLAVAARTGASRREVRATLEALVPAAQKGPPRLDLRFLDMEKVEISSSMARERAARGEPIEDLVGVPVARYVAEQDLYLHATAGRAA